MKLTSSAFSHNGLIPSRYTCDANNVSPPLKIEFVPVLAKSLVLIMDDPDIPDFVKEKFHIEVFDHWVSFNIDPKTTEIKDGQVIVNYAERKAGEPMTTQPSVGYSQIVSVVNGTLLGQAPKGGDLNNATTT